MSHRHYDHYQRSIFRWSEGLPRITYILSGDVKEAVPSYALKGDILFVGPGESLRIGEGEGELFIETLESTDEGVAFVVKAEGRTIYHAGDLNWWHWEEETDRYNQLMKEDYQREIGKLEGLHIDAAFLPLDPRLGKEYLLGIGLVYAPHRHGYRVPHAHAGSVRPVRSADGRRQRLATGTEWPRITGEGQVFIFDEI